ncbi:MAG: CarD family transcriptional regulator [Pseudomonadota bacterium]
MPVAKKNITNLRSIKNQPKAFKSNEYVVYPSHGVGKILNIESQQIGDASIDLIIIEFCSDRMKLCIPVHKATDAGLRRISTRTKMEDVIRTLQGKSRIRRTMWARRAQEYESKINSGNPVAIAEVVRDLFRGAAQPDQTYSERQLYQLALLRLAREYAVIEALPEEEACLAIEELMTQEAA